MRWTQQLKWIVYSYIVNREVEINVGYVCVLFYVITELKNEYIYFKNRNLFSLPEEKCIFI